MNDEIVGQNAVGSDAVVAPGGSPPPAEQQNNIVVEKEQTSMAKDLSLDEELRKKFRELNAEPERDEAGRFKSKQENVQPTDDQLTDNKEETKSEETQQQAAPPVADAPASWNKEMKETWGKLPPEAQKYISERESQAHSVISQQGQLIAQFRPVGEMINKHIDVFRAEGVTPQDGIERLLQAHRMLNERPAEAIFALMNMYGVDPSTYLQGQVPGQQPSQQPTGEVGALRKQIAQLEARLGEVGQTVKQREQQDIASQRELLVSEINQFAKDNPLVEECESEFRQMVQGIRSQIEDGTRQPMTWSNIFKEAYDHAVWANPKTRQTVLQKQKEAETSEAVKKAEEQKKTAAKAVGTRPQPANSRSAPSMEDTLRDTAKAIYGRAG